MFIRPHDGSVTVIVVYCVYQAPQWVGACHSGLWCLLGPMMGVSLLSWYLVFIRPHDGVSLLSWYFVFIRPHDGVSLLLWYLLFIRPHDGSVTVIVVACVY